MDIRNATRLRRRRKDCVTKSGHLVSLHNKFQNDLLVTYATERFNSSYYVRMGLTRGNGHSDWGWSDNTTYDYMNWAFISGM
ncbi:unnamed protein product, partial [Mesorhabditis spiculigera]